MGGGWGGWVGPPALWGGGGEKGWGRCHGVGLWGCGHRPGVGLGSMGGVVVVAVVVVLVIVVIVVVVAVVVVVVAVAVMVVVVVVAVVVVA